jgi:hypothetical protein
LCFSFSWFTSFFMFAWPKAASWLSLSVTHKVFWQKLNAWVHVWHWSPPTAMSWWNQWGGCGSWSLRYVKVTELVCDCHCSMHSSVFCCSWLVLLFFFFLLADILLDLKLLTQLSACLSILFRLT